MFDLETLKNVDPAYPDSYSLNEKKFIGFYTELISNYIQMLENSVTIEDIQSYILANYTFVLEPDTGINIIAFTGLGYRLRITISSDLSTLDLTRNHSSMEGAFEIYCTVTKNNDYLPGEEAIKEIQKFFHFDKIIKPPKNYFDIYFEAWI